MMDEIVVNDLKVCELKNTMDGYKKIKVNLYTPSRSLKGDGLDFDPAIIREEIKLGYEDAKKKGT